MSAQSEIGGPVDASQVSGATGQPIENSSPVDPNTVMPSQTELEQPSDQTTEAAQSAPAGGEPVAMGTERTGRTRLSASWTAVVTAAIVLIALVIFIGQNTQQSTVNFLGTHGKAPTAVVLLIAALAGAIIVIAVGISRILQLRKTARQARREAQHRPA